MQMQTKDAECTAERCREERKAAAKRKDVHLQVLTEQSQEAVMM